MSWSGLLQKLLLAVLVWAQVVFWMWCLAVFPTINGVSLKRMQKGEGEVGELMQKVHQGMCDDLNTPQAISALSAPLKTMNDLLSTKKGKKAKGRLQTLAQYQMGLQQTLDLLGMQVAKPEQQLHEMRQLALSRSVVCYCHISFH